jgi:carbamoyltransferase
LDLRNHLEALASEIEDGTMSSRSSITSPWKWLGRGAYAVTLPIARSLSVFQPANGKYANERMQSLREKLSRGETAYLLGIGAGGHNAGVGLIEVSTERGIRLIANHEEERFRSIKHFKQFPAESLQVLDQQMRQLGIPPSEIHAACASWDYSAWLAKAVQSVVEELPGSLTLLRPGASPDMNLDCVREARKAPRELGKWIHQADRPFPVIGLRHHDNHAWFSWGCSPFAKSDEPVMVLVIDGAGDEGAISSYVMEQGTMRRLYKNDSLWDSLGMMYGILSSSQGGWPLLSSEGRYMGAAAWGNVDRLTNPYYLRLRDIFVFESEGRIFLNRSLANWHRGGGLHPYTQRLCEILGPPILPDQMWDPDAVLNVEDVAHAPITRDRVDKAAAVQLVFEDALFHIVQHLIRTTRSTRLVLTGGTALNCVANMLLLEHFHSEWYERNLGMKDSRLHLWVPPVPGDQGVSIGAAYHFACLAGARPGEPMQHAFYCGQPAARIEIEKCLRDCPDIHAKTFGNIHDPAECERIGDLMAWIVSLNGVIGIYQGAAETGPRALGHRSILANPTNAKTRETLNQFVKFRELIRPLAPMATLEAARQWFHLSDGAADDNYNAYNYMILTTRAKQEAYEKIPAVIHHDGTCRVQIVRPSIDPLIYSYLKAMGRRVGVEVSVNTSLNVGAPIAQTPLQALDTLRRSKGLHGLFMISAEGDAFLAWHHVEAPPKDAGRTLNRWIDEWNSIKAGARKSPFV